MIAASVEPARQPGPVGEGADTIKGEWKQISGRIQTQWGKLTNDDLDVAHGHREYLVGKVQERYGIARDKAEEEVTRFERSL